MRQIVIWSIVFFLFLLEGTVVQWLIPASGPNAVHISSRIVMVAILYVAIFQNSRNAMWGGLAFGMLQDFIYYGHMLGLHSFCMGLTGYLTGKSFTHRRYTLFSVLYTIVLGLVFYEGLVNTLYRMADVVTFSLGWSLTHIILPSLLFNTFFALLIYIPAYKLLHENRKEKEEELDD